MNEILQQIAPLFKEMRPEEQQAVLKALHADDGEAQLRQIMAARTAQAGVPRRRTIVDADFTGELSDFAKVSPEAMGRPRVTQPVSTNGQANVDIPTPLDPELYQVMPELVDPIQSVPGFEGGAPQFKDSKTLRILQGVLGGAQVLGAAFGGNVGTGIAAGAGGGASKAEEIRAQRYAQFVGDMDAYRQAMSNQIEANKRIEIANARQVQDAREQSIDNYWNAIEESRRQATATSENEKREIDIKIKKREQEVFEQAFGKDPEAVVQGVIDKYASETSKRKYYDEKAISEKKLGGFREARTKAVGEFAAAHKQEASTLEGAAKKLKTDLETKRGSFKARNPRATDEELQPIIEAAAADSTDELHRRALDILQMQEELQASRKRLIEIRGYDEAGKTGVPGDSAQVDPMDNLIQGIIGGDPAFNVETQLESDEYGEDLKAYDQFMR